MVFQQLLGYVFINCLQINLLKGVDKSGVLWYNIGRMRGKSEKESFSEKTQKTFQKPLDKSTKV